MARTVKDATIGSPAARAKLAPRGRPYWRSVERGLHLGYRRLKGKKNGTWWARHYLGDQQYKREAIGDADDHSNADGLVVLTFDQAQAKARLLMIERARKGNSAGVSVQAAVEDYIATRDKRESTRKGRNARSDAATRLKRYVLSTKLAEATLDDLEESELAKWRADLSSELKATTKQRLVNDFRAALNSAHRKYRRQLAAEFPATIKNGLRAPDSEDGDAEPVARDNQILTDAQVVALIAAAREVDGEQDWDGDLFRMVVVLAATGARFSQVARMKVGDVQRPNGRLMVPTSRKGRGRKAVAHIPMPVGRDVLDALLPAVTGRGPAEPLLQRWRHVQVPGKDLLRWQRDSRGPWSSSAELTRPWDHLRKEAGMPAVIPYALRHSSIVRGIGANLPIRLVAALHDTSVAMIEKHYSKWIASGLDELAAAAVVSLVPVATGNVTSFRREA